MQSAVDETVSESTQQNHLVRGTIYELVDPRDGACKYVGQTISVEKRRQSHQARRPIYQQNNALYRWQWALRESGMIPEFRVIEDCLPLELISAREKYWCQERAKQGFELLNRPVGGITKEDLLCAEKKVQISLAAADVLYVLEELHKSFAGKLPMRHKANRHIKKAIEQVQFLKWSFE